MVLDVQISEFAKNYGSFKDYKTICKRSEGEGKKHINVEYRMQTLQLYFCIFRL